MRKHNKADFAHLVVTVRVEGQQYYLIGQKGKPEDNMVPFGGRVDEKQDNGQAKRAAFREACEECQGLQAVFSSRNITANNLLLVQEFTEKSQSGNSNLHRSYLADLGTMRAYEFEKLKNTLKAQSDIAVLRFVPVENFQLPVKPQSRYQTIMHSHENLFKHLQNEVIPQLLKKEQNYRICKLEGSHQEGFKTRYITGQTDEAQTIANLIKQITGNQPKVQITSNGYTAVFDEDMKTEKAYSYLGVFNGDITWNARGNGHEMYIPKRLEGKSTLDFLKAHPRLANIESVRLPNHAPRAGNNCCSFWSRPIAVAAAVVATVVIANLTS